MSRTCDICHKTYSCRQNLWRHKKNVHEKSNPEGSGLWTQTVNNQMKWGRGNIDKYIWKWGEKASNKNHSPLLP